MPRIPKHFHFIFGLREQTEPFHLAWYLCLKSCLAVNPDYRLTLHYLNEPYGPYWDRIRSEIELVRLDGVPDQLDRDKYRNHVEGQFIQSSQLEYAHQSDILRLQILEEHGGIYTDIDSIFVRPYPDELLTHPCVMGQEAPDCDPPTLCNAVIMAEARSRFIETWIDRIGAAFDGTWNRHSCVEPARISEELPGAIEIVGRELFYYFKHDQAGLISLLGNVTPLPDTVCSIHLWNHLWWEPWRNDFIYFNKTHLTEELIRTVDSTYNLIARQHLPDQS